MTTVNDYIQDLLTETHDLESFLNALTHITAESMSVEGGEVLCGITLRRHKRAGTVASNNALAQRLDEVQYDFGDGPCLSACTDQRIFNIPDIEQESRWPEYFREKGYPFRCPNCTHRSTLVSVARHGRSTGPRSKEPGLARGPRTPAGLTALGFGTRTNS